MPPVPSAGYEPCGFGCSLKSQVADRPDLHRHRRGLGRVAPGRDLHGVGSDGQVREPIRAPRVGLAPVAVAPPPDADDGVLDPLAGRGIRHAAHMMPVSSVMVALLPSAGRARRLRLAFSTIRRKG